MDRIDAMLAFVTVVDAGGFSAAARKLGRSPAAITRAVALLERRTSTSLLRRTTRVVKLTPGGERYLDACRRILSEIDRAEQSGLGEKAAPRGLLTISAPVMFGRLYVRQRVDTFLERNVEVEARLLLLDRIVRLVDEGVDVAIRIAHLPDSSLVATKVGAVERVLCASPEYLARSKKIRVPADLAGHTCIGLSEASTTESWPFKGARAERTRHVKISPRLTSNSVDVVIGSALDGHGVARVLSYQVSDALSTGRLIRVLPAFEGESLPIHVVHTAAGASSAKVRAFVDFVVPKLRAALTRRSGRTRSTPRDRGSSDSKTTW